MGNVFELGRVFLTIEHKVTWQKVLFLEKLQAIAYNCSE